MVGVVVVGIVYLGARDQDLSTLRLESSRASYAAIAAANMAMQEIASNVDQDADGTIGSVASGTVASGYAVNSAKCAASVSVSGSTYTVTAMGLSNRAQHAYELVATRTSAATYPGLYLQCFELGSAPGNCDSIDWTATPGWTGVVPNVDMPHLYSNSPYWTGGPGSTFAMRFQGTVTIPTAGTWTFYTYSDDGTKLYINGALVVSNDGDHSPQTRSGTIALAAGTATFDLKYYENGGEVVNEVSWSGPGVASQTIIPTSAFNCTPTTAVAPVVGTTSVTLSGGGSGLVFDGFNSNSGVYGGANVLTTGIVTQTNATAMSSISVTNATLYGSAVCGVGGNPAVAITTGAGGSIPGSKTAAASGAALTMMGVPAGMPASMGDVTFSGTTTINSNYHLGNMSVTGGTITISGNVIGQIDGNVSMSSNAALNVPAGSTLTLYVGGTFTMSNTSTLNVSAGDPRSVKIYMTGAAKAMTLNGSAKCCAITLNPDGGLSVVGGSTPAPEYSGVFQGKTINLQSNAKFHADVSAGGSAGSTAGTILTQWKQIQ